MQLSQSPLDPAPKIFANFAEDGADYHADYEADDQIWIQARHCASPTARAQLLRSMSDRVMINQPSKCGVNTNREIPVECKSLTFHMFRLALNRDRFIVNACLSHFSESSFSNSQAPATLRFRQ